MLKITQEEKNSLRPGYQFLKDRISTIREYCCGERAGKTPISVVRSWTADALLKAQHIGMPARFLERLIMVRDLLTQSKDKISDQRLQADDLLCELLQAM